MSSLPPDSSPTPAPTQGPKPETLLSHAGRQPDDFFGAVNVPPFRASTILFPTLDALEAHDPEERMPRYGRRCTPSSLAFEDTVAALEGGYRAIATSSGLSAVTTALLTYARAGGHVLLADTIYGPSREFCDHMLTGMGVTVEYYDPLIGAGIAALIRENTQAILAESPGSLTFEVQDIPALSHAAHAHGVPLLIDSTWSAGLCSKPLALGADVVIHAATKYFVGHADATLGVIVGTQESWPRLKRTAVMLGQNIGADDLFLALRGMRTLAARMKRHQETGLILARWLKTRPEVARVLHPALPDCPGHDIFLRDFQGSSGLFTVALHPQPRAAIAALVEGMRYFAMGFSWGGYESLILPTTVRKLRTARPWTSDVSLVRLHAGLEDPDDLIRDLEQGLARMKSAQ